MTGHVGVGALALLLLAGTTTGTTPSRFRDFSQAGADYAALQNLRFATGTVTYSGPEPTVILGRRYLASKYLLRAVVTVETSEMLGPTSASTYEKRLANFAVLVADDKDGSVRHGLAYEMFSAWSKKELFAGNHSFDFHLNGSCYALTAVPDNVEVKLRYLVWVNSRVAEIIFDGFSSGGRDGWGIMDSSAKDDFRISLDNTEVPAYAYPLRAQRKFLKLYAAGFFDSPGACR